MRGGETLAVHLWYVNSGEGRLGRYNLKSGELKEWPSPSGTRSHPYAIVVANGAVWYNESGQRPDATRNNLALEGVEFLD